MQSNLEPVTTAVLLKMNEHLPFDVLCDIFSYYQQQEDAFYPVETLLLVCKFWAEVALSHRVIWGRFRIRFGHEPILKMWRKRLPLRLMRSGAHYIPLDIDVRSESFDLDEEVLRNARFYSKKCFDKKGSRMSRCRCNSAHAAMITWMFDVLVGNNGELCSRWRTLRIHSGTERYTVHLGSAVTSLGNAITSPTPSLISLSLINVSVSNEMNINHTAIPSAPLLQELMLGQSSLPHLPDMSNVRKIEIYCLHITDLDHISLQEATRMQELTIIQASQQIILAPVLHELSQLTLTGANLPSTFERTSMPQLTHLSVSLWNWDLCCELAECIAFPLEQLVQLEIGRPRHVYSIPTYGDLARSVFRLLRRSTRLNSIISSLALFNLVVKWMWEDRRSFDMRTAEIEGGLEPWHWQESLVLVSPSGDCLMKLAGNESSARLESLALEWRLASPDMSWDTLLAILFHSPSW
jgi:hypothetical protein